MTDWESQWVQLTEGVYLHRWLPRLAVVRSELTKSLGIRDDLTGPEWCIVAGQILDTAEVSWPEVMDAGIRVEDVLILQEVDHVA